LERSDPTFATDGPDREALRQALAASRPRLDRPHLYVDVTAIARHDLNTGIQRVVNGVLSALMQHPQAAYRIEPVRLEGESYRLATRFTLKLCGLPTPSRRTWPCSMHGACVAYGCCSWFTTCCPCVTRNGSRMTLHQCMRAGCSASVPMRTPCCAYRGLLPTICVIGSMSIRRSGTARCRWVTSTLATTRPRRAPARGCLPMPRRCWPSCARHRRS